MQNQIVTAEAVSHKLKYSPHGPEKDIWKKQVLEGDGEVAFPLFDKENLGKQVKGGILKAKGEILEDQVPVQHLKPFPVPKEGVFEKKTTGLELGKDKMAEASVPCQEEQDDTQKPAQAAGPAKPSNTNTTTYRNLQPHDYTAYTFLDLNLDLSKFSMPQASSGQESPHH